ncbi:hypothetical protein RI054_03g15050 [Pseudoscourfieldia marina]
MTARAEVFVVHPGSTIAHEQEAGGELLPRVVADLIILKPLPCVQMATVASTSRRTSRPQTSRPQPVVTRKRKRQEGDDDPVAVLADQGIGGIEQFRSPHHY